MYVCLHVGTHTHVQLAAMFPVVKIPGSGISQTCVETPALPSNSYVTLSKRFNLSASVSTSVKRGNGRMRFLLGVVRTQQGDTYSAQKQAPDKVMMATCGWRETWGTCAGNVRPGGLRWGRESCRGATAAGLAMALPWRGKASGSHVQEERGRWVQEEGQSWE